MIVTHRVTFEPVPLYHLAGWAKAHGIDHVLGLEADGLDDDRLGAMLDGLADHQATLGSQVVALAPTHRRTDPADHGGGIGGGLVGTPSSPLDRQNRPTRAWIETRRTG